MLIRKSLVAWLAILALAFANGALREMVLIPVLGQTTGLLTSGAILSVLVALVSFAFVHLVRGITAFRGLGIGAMWLCLTLVFEFSFGRFIQHKAWSELLDAYSFKGGNIWTIVLLVILLAPSAVVFIQTRMRHAHGGV
jgi:hypothetical protein